MSNLDDTSRPVLTSGLSLAAEQRLTFEMEKFVSAELSLLDDREFEAWADLFTADGIYWAPSRIEQTDPLAEVSLLYDDHEIREMRFRRLRHPRVHAQVPFSRTSHLIGNLVIDAVDEKAGEIAFHCRFIMHDYRPEWPQREFAGRYDYRLVRQGGELRIKYKKATVINCDAMHFPVSIPL